MRPQILIVDDHQSIRDPLAEYLQRFDFEVATAADGQAMRQMLERQSFDLIVLDLMLPGENGLSLCRFISEHLRVPVIVLTAVTDQADRVAGLEVGADDYVTKPFDPRELVARIRSVLRRSQISRTGQDANAIQPHAPEQVVVFDQWRFDVARRELLNPHREAVPLSTAEYHLLHALVMHANRVLSRSQLLDLTQREENASFDRSIDSQVSRLRKKLELDPRQPSLLKTVRGDGYVFTAKVVMGQP